MKNNKYNISIKPTAPRTIPAISKPLRALLISPFFIFLRLITLSIIGTIDNPKIPVISAAIESPLGLSF